MNIPPDSKNIHLYIQNQELLKKVESLQISILQAEKLFQEMLKLKDEHIEFFKSEIKNLPALVLSQLQEQLQPP